MYPHERSLVEKMQNEPFALIGVNSDQSKDVVKKAIEQEKLTWRSFWNGGSTNGPISREWRVEGWPTLYLIDHKGVIKAKIPGAPRQFEQLDSAITQLVRVAKSDIAKKEKAKQREEAKTAAKTPTKSEESGSDEKNDELAATKLKFAKSLIDDGKKDKARERLQEIIKKYPKSNAAEEAKELLKKLK
jgi:FimV-like protein